jgi:hypothetical protein
MPGGGGDLHRRRPIRKVTRGQYAHLVEHGFFKGQLDLASTVLPNPRTC